MRIQINKDNIVEGVDINHNKIIEFDIPDTAIVDLFDRYQELKNEYDNWLESKEADRLRQGWYNIPSFQTWVYERVLKSEND